MKMTQKNRDKLVAMMLTMLKIALNDPECAAIQIFHEDGTTGIMPVPVPVGCEIDLETCMPTGNLGDGGVEGSRET